MNTIERIIALSNAFGPSGFEDDVAALVREELPEYDTYMDHMTNVRCEKEHGSDKPRVMFDAHMDEVGAIVQMVKPNGTMKFLPIGGWMDISFPSSAFLIRSKEGKDIPAVVAVKPPHYTNKKEELSVDEMILDAGTVTDTDTFEMGIGIGSPCVPDVKCRYFEDSSLFYGKAFDDRIGVAAQIDTLNRLLVTDLPCNVLGSFSVQEEVGERGVRANYLALKPDVMICFEGCPADDTFMEMDFQIQTALKKGPMLRHMDRGMITNWRFQKLALDCAKENDIPVQEAVRKGGGTNAEAINSFYGIPAIVIGIPVRYAHSSHCWCSLDDYEKAVDLACKIAEKLDWETVNKL